MTGLVDGILANGRRERIRCLVASVLVLSAVVGCDSKEVTQCRSSYLTAHALVSSVDTSSLESVQQALKSVNGSLAQCESAALQEEIKQLKKALPKLQSHQSYLLHQATQKKLTPEELTALQKAGDPSCPKGQAYKYAKSDKKIRCTGPQLAHLNWIQAETYFTNRGYKIIKREARLRAEYGSESYTYSFSKVEDEAPAKCLTLFAAPTIPWQEAVARVTGVAPQRLKVGTPVKTARGSLALGVISDQHQAIIKLGDCEK